MPLRRYAHRALGIARDMTPSVDLTVKTAIRASMGLALLWTGHPWLDLAGKFMLLVAAYGLVGHMEGTFVAHASGKLRMIGSSMWTVCLMVYCIVTLPFLKEPWFSKEPLP